MKWEVIKDTWESRRREKNLVDFSSNVPDRRKRFFPLFVQTTQSFIFGIVPYDWNFTKLLFVPGTWCSMQCRPGVFWHPAVSGLCRCHRPRSLPACFLSNRRGREEGLVTEQAWMAWHATPPPPPRFPSLSQEPSSRRNYLETMLSQTASRALFYSTGAWKV